MKPLTDQVLRSLPRPKKGKRLELIDARCTGLAFRVTDQDARSFSFRFRDPKGGRVQRYTLGDYPDLTLSKARRKADELRGQVANGINPVEARKRERQTAASRSFGAVAARYLEEHAKRHNRPSTQIQAEGNLNRHILPQWKNRHIDTIERSDIVELTERLITAGKPVMANRVQALISTIYSFALDAGLCKVNPSARLRKRGVETRATRVLSDDEIRQFWGRAPLAPLSRPTGLALRLILLTGCRPGEAAGITRKELEHFEDAEKAIWNIPAERTKNGRAHVVPLSCLARETIRAALELIPAEQDFIFATRLKRGGGLHPHSLTVAMKRLSGMVKGPGADTWKKNVPTPHDLRRTLATRLASLGTPGEDVSAVLNHVRRDVTGMHYDQYARLAEKRRALVAWAESLKGILGNEVAQ
jgi:integrase